MTVTELTHPALGTEDWRWVRWELFVFSDVRDVLPGTCSDAVLVVHRGAARVGDWLCALWTADMLGAQPAREPRRVSTGGAA